MSKILGALDRALHAIDLNVWWIARRFGLTAASYCDLETVDVESGHAFVASDGSLMSVLRLDGTSRLVGAANFGEIIDRFAAKLGAFLRQPAHSVQIVLIRDAGIEALDRELTEALTPALQTARRLHLEMSDVLRERALRLSQYCAVERGYLVLWTSAQALAAMERQAGRLDQASLSRNLPPAPEAQRPVPTYAVLRESHRSLVETVRTDLAGLGLHVTLLDARDALHAIRYEVDPEWTDDGFEPAFPGSRAKGDRSYRHPEPGQHPQDASHLLWPSLARQLIPRGIEPMNTRSVRIGDRIYQPVTLAMPPARLEPFSSLFERLRETGISYRISFRLSGHGINDTEIQLRRLAALFSTSKAVKEALKEAADTSLHAAPRIGMQMEAVTWVHGDDVEALRRAGARLARAIQGWGGCDVDARLGNPTSAVMGSIPGLLRLGVGTLSLPPMTDALALMPLLRPASPWTTGAILLRTPDGKLYPYQPYSSEQSAWVTLAYAPMGAGKSVLLSSLNVGLCLSAGAEELPYLAILDIGPSSSGAISLLRESLPQHLRHLVMHRRLRMAREDSINPCDTLLGMRAPLPPHRAFLVNLLSLLATPIGQLAPPPDVTNVVGSALDIAYEKYSDAGTEAHRYDRGVEPLVDELIEAHGISLDERSIWWEVVDALFAAGELHAAYLAQRHATPLVAEIAALCKDSRVADQFGGEAPNREPITDYVYRSITQAVREYAVLSGPTRLDLGGARIVALDLAEVAPQGGPAADRQTAVMYLLGRHVLASDCFVHVDYLPLAKMPAMYRDFHEQTIRRAQSTAKGIVFDELHRTRHAPLVSDQIELDIREGRKSKVAITLASQMLGDFRPSFIDLASSIFILGVGETTRAATLETFRLGEEAAAILDRMGKPSSAGARMLCIFRTKGGQYVHELMHTLSATELWAYNTTAEDRAIRDRLYQMIGPQAARYILSRIYPSGSAVPDIERRRGAMIDPSDGHSGKTLIETIVQELMLAYERSVLDASSTDGDEG